MVQVYNTPAVVVVELVRQVLKVAVTLLVEMDYNGLMEILTQKVEILVH